MQPRNVDRFWLVIMVGILCSVLYALMAHAELVRTFSVTVTNTPGTVGLYVGRERLQLMTASTAVKCGPSTQAASEWITLPTSRQPIQIGLQLSGARANSAQAMINCAGPDATPVVVDGIEEGDLPPLTFTPTSTSTSTPTVTLTATVTVTDTPTSTPTATVPTFTPTLSPTPTETP